MTTLRLVEFIKYCKDGIFVDYDGFGCYTEDGKELKKVRPSNVGQFSKSGDFNVRKNIDLTYEFLNWYNR